MQENVDYEIIPSYEDEQAWNVRILKGPYTQTVIKYGTVAFNKIKDNMSFNFHIVYSPDTELTTDDYNLQDFAGEMLEKIISAGIKEGSIATREIVDDN